MVGRIFLSRPRHSIARAAFTLVELLVVLGIIALLISILLPTLSKVRQQYNAVHCSTNLRTFGQAFQQYANANRGTCVPVRLPTSGAPGGVFDIGDFREYRPRWYELLGAQVGVLANESPKTSQDDKWTIRKKLFLCASVPEYNNSRNFPYGYNYQFLGNARPRGGGGKRWICYPVRASLINGSGTVMAADSLGTAAGAPRDMRSGYHADGDHDPFGLLNKGYCIDPPRLTKDSDFADPENRQPEHRAGPDPRHSGKCNVLFCDGHVSLMFPQEMGYHVLADGSMPVSGGTVHNRLFSGRGEDLDPPPIN
jgi:prepilin-type processing-associated H-X9-DG protein/prepilin-type N-terminal cleavage/methylation domain-containing protein